MAYEVTYANNNLHDYFKILNVHRTISPTRENFTKDISGVHGKYYMGYKYSEKIIRLDCLLKSQNSEEYIDILNKISFLLDVSEPQRLIISDNPHMFCYAIPNAISDPSKLRFNATFTIEFVCYDPYSYSIEDDYFDADSMGITTIENAGTADTYPVIDTVFQKQSNFFMATNFDGRTILLGNPLDEESNSTNSNVMVLKDPCETLEDWVSVSENVLDSGRKITGNLQINASGQSIMCGNYGTDENGWHGGALRRNLSQSVSDFEFKVKVQHNSKGTLYINDGTAVTNQSGTFTVTAKSGQPVYKNRSTSSTKVTTIPQNKSVKVTEITKNWGAVTYDGKSGYVDTSKMKYKTATTSSSSSSSSSTYPKTYNGKVNTGGSNLMLRKGKGTSYAVLTKIPDKTSIKVTQEKSSDTWLKTTYGGKTGYVSKQYVKAVTSTKMVKATSDDSAERQKGRIEITGFSKQGDKLFKCVMRDSSGYYEYTQPEVWIGNTLVIEDGKVSPDPKTRKEVDKDGKTITRKINSGKYGDWNEFNGWFTIKRTTDNRGKQTWQCLVEKLKDDGTVGKNIPYKKTTTTQFPTGELASIVLWIGQWKAEPVVTTMQCSHIQVKNLKNVQEKRIPIFEKGDELVIDNETQKIYLNGSLFMNELDIGSEFFSSPVGESQFKCITDGGNLNIGTSIKKRWL